jgi:amidase
MLHNEIAMLDAHAQAQMIRTKKITASELMDATITRLEHWNPLLNAVTIPMLEHARAKAATIPCDLPFSGVPALLKDLGSTCAEAEMTCGSAFLRGVVPDHDSELVRRFRNAGLVFLGKTNCAEFGALPTTEPKAFGPTRNPWNFERSVGGSSGGAAAAVAVGLVPVAHANDGGGSIRIPASCTGVFGLKPTRARTPFGPDIGDIMNGMVVEHVITRSVRDSAALLDAIHGPDIGDPYYAPTIEGSFIDALTNRRRLRIAFHAAGSGLPLHPDCKKAVSESVALCSALGHIVEEVEPIISMTSLADAFFTVWAAGVASAVGSFSRLTGRTPSCNELEPMTWKLLEEGNRISAGQYLMTITYLQQISRQIARFFEHYDLLLSATTSEPAPLLGVLDGSQADRAHFNRVFAFTNITPLANVTGQPAMSVPLYWNDDGLPIGTHFMARSGDEHMLFALAAELEEAKPWARRRPWNC